MRSQPKLQKTKNYSLFVFGEDNRNIDTNTYARRQLRKDMQENGFSPHYPISCVRRKDGKLEILDGQHRYTIAVELGLPVWYIEWPEDYDVARRQCETVPWKMSDYASRYARQGKTDYQEVIQFSEQYGLPISLAAQILRNNAPGSGNINKMFKEGRYTITTRESANSVAKLYLGMVQISKALKNRFVLSALYACFLVEYFSPERLLASAANNKDKIDSYGNRDAYLSLFETLYNYHRPAKSWKALRMDALAAIQKRNPSNHK